MAVGLVGGTTVGRVVWVPLNRGTVNDLPNIGVDKKCLWGCCLGLVVTVVVPFALVWLLTRPLDDRVDRRGDWDVFYESEVSRFAAIPGDAAIVEAVEMTDFPMGGGFRVVFALPDTKTPEEWMLDLTTGGGVKLREHKVSEYFYDASRKVSDVYWLRYFPDEKHYVLRYHWD